MANKSLVWEFFGRDRTVSRTLKGLSDDAEKAHKKFSNMGKAIGAGFAAVGFAAADFAYTSLKAYSQAEDQQNKLEFAFKKFPALADSNIEAFRNLNLEIQKKTKFDDDDMAAAQATMAQYKLTGAQIMQLTPLIADYATKTGKDLPTAAQDLGKAMLGQGRALKAVGIQFKDTGSPAGNFAEIVDGLKGKVGGLAEAAGGTVSGKLEILGHRFQEVQEKVGKALMPALDGLIKMFEDGMPAIENFAKWFAKDGIPGIKAFIGFLVKFKDDIIPALIVGLVLWQAAQWALNGAMDANPIGAVVLVIEALIAIIIILALHWGDITKFLGEAWANVCAFFAEGAKSIAGFWDQLVAGFNDGINGIVSWWNDLVGAFGNGANQIGSWWAGVVGFFSDGVNSVVGFWNSLVAGFNAGIAAIVSWWNGLVTNVTNYINLIVRGFVVLETMFIRVLIQMWQNVINFFVNGWNWVVSMFSAAVNQIGGFFRSIYQWFQGVIDWCLRLVLQWRDTIAKFIAGLIGWIQQVQQWFQALPGKIMGWLSDAGKWLFDTGKNVIQGLINGVGDMAGKVGTAIQKVAHDIIEGVKHFFGIASPSTVFAEIGGHLMTGLFNGILGKGGDFQKVLGKVFGGIPQNLMGALGVMGGAAGDIFAQLFGFEKGGGSGKSTPGGAVIGGNVGGGAAQWSGLVLQVLGMLGQSASNLPAVLRRINMESGGNPNAINLWDINAKNGVPSRGLMQTIPGTFAAYSGPFRSRGITDPLANIYAGLNYAIQRYGSIRAIDPLVRPSGYDAGGLLPPGMNLVYNGTGQPETIIPPRAGQLLADLLQDRRSASVQARGNRPIYMDGTLFGYIREIADGSAQLVVNKAFNDSGTSFEGGSGR